MTTWVWTADQEPNYDNDGWLVAGGWNSTLGQGTPIAGDTVAIAVGHTVNIVTPRQLIGQAQPGGQTYSDTVVSAFQTVLNSGTILLDAAASTTHHANWVITGTVLLSFDPNSNPGTGGAPGVVALTDDPNNRIGQTQLAQGTLVNLNNTIRGAGTISLAELVNAAEGHIIADVASPLILTATVGNLIVNNGVMQSTNPLGNPSPGGLVLSNVQIDQTNTTSIASIVPGGASGQIRADGPGAHVDFMNGTVVHGGTLATTNGGVINVSAATFDGAGLDGNGHAAPVHISSGSTVAVGASFSALQVAGAIDNAGTISLNSAGTNSISTLQVNGNATLSGGGTIAMSDFGFFNTNRVQGNINSTLVNADNTIQGAGTIDGQNLHVDNLSGGIVNANGTQTLALLNFASTQFANAGVIEATGNGDLVISTSLINQSGSGAIIASGAGARVDITGSSTIQGGTLSTSNGGIIHVASAMLDAVTNGAIAIDGTVQVDSGNAINLVGTLANSGTLLLDAAATPGSFANVNLLGTTHLMGPGEVAGSGRLIGSVALTNDSTISATGNGAVQSLDIVAGSFTNTGTLHAAAGSALSVRDDVGNDFTNLGGGTLSGGTYVVDSNGLMAFYGSAGPITTLAADVGLSAGSVLSTTAGAIESTLTTIADGAHLSLFAHNATWANAIVDNGTINLNNDTFTDEHGLTITSGGGAGGFGHFNTTIADNGIIVALGGALTFDRDVSGTGNVLIGDAATADFRAVATVATVSFDGVVDASIDTLVIENAAGFHSTIMNFGADDRIIVSGATAVTLTGAHTLQVTDAGGTHDLTLGGDYTGRTVSLGAGGAISLDAVAVNQPPTVTPLSAATGEDGPTFTQNLLQGASDPNGDALSAVNPSAQITTTGGRVLTLGADYTASGNQFALTAAGFAQFNSLGAGQTDTIHFNFGVSDGVNAAVANQLTLTVNGANDAASIAGPATGAVTEDAAQTTTGGTLTVSDPDAGQNVFAAVAPASLNGTYGTFTFNATSGAWGYALDNTRAATQGLGAGVVAHDTLTVQSLDLSATQQIGVAITGANDAAVISGPVTGSVTEDGAATAAGTLTVLDPDAGQSGFVAASSLAGTYGTFTFDASSGAWGYTLDSTRAATQGLGAGVVAHDILTVHSIDGTAQQIDVAVNGVNDPASIAGTSTGAVTEDTASQTTAGGTLTVLDADAGQNVFAAVPPAGLNGTYGTFTFNASTGAWGYTLDNTRAATQALNAGTAVHDTLTVQSLDGTATRVIDVTVNGQNEASGDIVGQPGQTTVNGTSGADHIVIGATNVFVNAGSGDDTITIKAGGTLQFHSINGGAGTDTLDLSGTSNVGGAGVTVDLGNGIAAGGQIGLTLLSSIENATGGAGNDTLIGSDAANRLDGGDGNDIVRGRGGNDTIIGGGGNDVLAGGAGADTFVFKAGFGRDVITDFAAGGAQHDVIDLTGFTGMTYADLHFTASNNLDVNGDGRGDGVAGVIVTATAFGTSSIAVAGATTTSLVAADFHL